MMSGISSRLLHTRNPRNFCAIFQRKKHILVFLRPGKSEWNEANRFTGWYDAPLSKEGEKEAIAVGKLLVKEKFKFDIAYTSYLKRAVKTCSHALEQVDQMHIPVIKAWQLNDKHSGALTGLNKQQTIDRHGKEQVSIWRRSYDIPPPALELSSKYYPGNDAKYINIPKSSLPTTESLSNTLDRILPYWKSIIAPKLLRGQRVLIAAHGNSIRALLKHIDGIPKDVITGVNIPTGVPLVYEFDDNLKVIPHRDAIGPLRGRYLGDRKDILARIRSA